MFIFARLFYLNYLGHTGSQAKYFNCWARFLANSCKLAATLSNLYVSQKIANTYRITYSKAECLRTCLTSRISHSYIVTKTDCTDSQTMNIMFTMQFVHFYNFLSPFHITNCLHSAPIIRVTAIQLNRF